MSNRDLRCVYDGWDGYNRSLVSSISDLTAEQLDFKGSKEMRSVGELVLHIADGRVDWFRRMDALHSAAELWHEISTRESTPELTGWLNQTYGK